MSARTSDAVSVCMATYNGAAFIHEQISSVLAQLRDDDEVIVFDDCSTDATREIVASFGDARIRVFQQPERMGVIRNFESAIGRATRDIIVLCDQDDVWLPGKLRVIRDAMSNTNEPVSLIVLNGAVVGENGAVDHASIFEQLRSGPGIARNIVFNTFLGCCMAFSRNVLDFALPFPHPIPMHDMWIGLVASMFGQVRFIDESTIHYRRHTNAASRTLKYFRFQPVTQLRWRWQLTSNLALRAWKHRAQLKR